MWLGEFGTGDDSAWWGWMNRLIDEYSLDWAYWALDGQKRVGEDETFGILNMDYATVRHSWKLADLQRHFNSDVNATTINNDAASE